MSWQFCAVFHFLILCVSVTAALFARKVWIAVFMCIGVFIGGVLAVVPLMLWMQQYERTTGFDAGNAGMLFVCTVPLFPVIGLVIGAAIGVAIDNSRDKKN